MQEICFELGCNFLYFILVPPSVQMDSSMHAVSLADEVMLHCDVFGDPSRYEQPTVWIAIKSLY